MNSTQKRNDVPRGVERDRVLQACRPFSAEQAMAWVISAYREATAFVLHPPPDEPWICPTTGICWADPCAFVNAFEFEFRRRVAEAWVKSGLPVSGVLPDVFEGLRIDAFVASQEPQLPRRSSMGESAQADGGAPC